MTAVTNADDLDARQDRAWMSERIGKSQDWISHNMGEIPHVKIGKTPWFTERLARQFIEAHTFIPNARTKRSQTAGRKR